MVLKKIVRHVKDRMKFNLWENTAQALDWFKKRYQEGKRWSFIQLDVVAMYPSIKKELFEEALKWIKTVPGVNVKQEEEELIWVNRQSLLYTWEEEWEKKEHSGFDVGIGSRDGAECCEIVDLFLLHQLTDVEKLLPKENIAAYRDDFLGCVGMIKSENERLKKRITAVFKRWGLEIEIQMNTTQVDYLDATMDFANGTHKPYVKPSAKIKYVHKK